MEIPIKLNVVKAPPEPKSNGNAKSINAVAVQIP